MVYMYMVVYAHVHVDTDERTDECTCISAFLCSVTNTYAQLTHTCRYMLTQTDLHSHAHSYMYHIHITYAYINTHAHTHIHTCRFVSPTESQFFEVTMKADRSLKYMASMMSV